MIISLLKRFKYLILALIAMGIITSLLEAAGISLFLPILDGINSSGASSIHPPLNRLIGLFVNYSLAQRIRIVALLLVVVTVIKGVAIFLNGIFAARLEIAVTKFQQMQCFKRLLEVEMGYFNRQKGAHLYTISVSYAGQFGNVARAIADIGPALFTLLVLLIMLFIISWQMTLIALVFAGISSVILSNLQKSAKEAGWAIAEINKLLNTTVFDLIHGMKTIRLFNRSEDMVKRFANDQNNWGKRLIRVAQVQSATKPIFEMISITGLAILLLVGSFFFINSGENGISVELLLVFLLVFSRLLPPIAALNQTRVTISVAMPTLNEVSSFLSDSESKRVKNGGKPFTGLIQGIEFRRVVFSYNRDSSFVMKKISLLIEKGSKIGIVGSSGSGKSTITELLLGFYSPSSGQIMVDGSDLKDIDLIAWRRKIGVVTQDTFLFNDTIRNNIAYANPLASNDEVESAAVAAHAHDFIKELPNGYDTLIGDRGVLLSGGQRQRLAIARAILAEPEILIFDEATSALDTESEQIVQKALYEVSKGRTVIAIAHRLSTIGDSDKIFVFEAGSLVQEGSHRELMNQKDSRYHKLVQMQSLLGAGHDPVEGRE